MKSRLLAGTAAVVCAICLTVGVLSQGVFAGDEQAQSAETYEAAAPESTFVILGEQAAPTEAPEVTDNRLTVPMYSDGALMGYCSMVNGEPYMGIADFCRALGLQAQVLEAGGEATVLAESFALSASEGQAWFECNGRYLYVENGVQTLNGALALPLEQMVECLGVRVSWDRVKWCMTVEDNSLAPLSSGETFYNESDVLWLSRLIFAMAGDADLDTQVGVGSVCVNRLGKEAFSAPANIYEVVTAKNAFSVVTNGMIYATPNETSILAAKLALEGCDVVGGATYVAKTDLGEDYQLVAQMDGLQFFKAA